MTKTKRDIAEARADLIERVETEGVFAAYDAALAICRDRSAPAPARATASATLFRVAGYFDRKDVDSRDKEPHEMTPEELQAAMRDVERQRAATLKTLRQVTESDGDVFD